VTDLRAARDELAAAARGLAQDGLVTGTSVNLSARAGEHFLAAARPRSPKPASGAPDRS
jgi:ribulose-5-phosphate 4-epimerase/fuculose-1-phosphate aldolase